MPARSGNFLAYGSVKETLVIESGERIDVGNVTKLIRQLYVPRGGCADIRCRLRNTTIVGREIVRAFMTQYDGAQNFSQRDQRRAKLGAGIRKAARPVGACRHIIDHRQSALGKTFG